MTGPRKKYPSDATRQVNIRMPDALKFRIEVSAANSGRSLNAEVLHLLTKSSGMTLREHFAGLAMQAIIAKSPFGTADYGVSEREMRVARGAIDYADALIAELAKGGEA